MNDKTTYLLLRTITYIVVFTFASCDATIHEYPVPQYADIVIEPHVDRQPPRYYKEVIYDNEWNRTVNELTPDLSLPYTLHTYFDMRVIIDIYQGNINDLNENRKRLQRRILYVNKDALPPQDTIHARLPHGEHYILAWADYVYKNSPDDLHYQTNDLTGIGTDFAAYPNNTHQRSSATGYQSFRIDFLSSPYGHPVIDGNDIVSHNIPVHMKRPSGRYRVVATDYEEFLATGGKTEGLTVKVIYKQYVSAGYNVARQAPNLFISTYSFNMRPDEVDYEGKKPASLFGDYIFTPNTEESNVLADFYFYDEKGNELNHCLNIEIPLYRNRETIIKGPFLTREVGGDSHIGIDENFEGEFVVGFN